MYKIMTNASGSGYGLKFPDPYNIYRIHFIDLHVGECDRNMFEFVYCMGRSI